VGISTLHSDCMAHLTHSALQQFSYPSSLLAHVPTTVSPTKAARSGQHSLTRSRKRTSSSNPGGPRKRSVQTSNVSPTTAQEATVAQVSVPSPQQANRSSYEPYMEAVLANCAGFYRVSNEFFVVQGWDTHRERASVRCSVLCLLESELNNLFRIIGITFILS